MAERYTEIIRRFCEAQGIEVPVGFGRHSASRYVAVDLSASPPKLVAKTWLKLEDLLYYLTHIAPGIPHRLLDFKDRQELALAGSRLERRDAF